MPTFYTEDLEIEVDEFLSSCNKHDIKLVIEYLVDEGYIKRGEEMPEKIGVLESEFFEKLNKLKDVYYYLNTEELESIDNMVKKYC